MILELKDEVSSIMPPTKKRALETLNIGRTQIPVGERTLAELPQNGYHCTASRKDH